MYDIVIINVEKHVANHFVITNIWIIVIKYVAIFVMNYLVVIKKRNKNNTK